jgi:hypothetical protein
VKLDFGYYKNKTKTSALKINREGRSCSLSKQAELFLKSWQAG